MSMNQMLSFLWEWRWIVAFLVIGVFYLIFNWRHALVVLKTEAPKAMLAVEKKAKEWAIQNGAAKMQVVAQYILATVVPTFPVWLRPFFTEVRVRAACQLIYDKSVDLMDNGKLDGSVQTPGN